MHQRDISKDKSVGELGLEAFWFLTHTLLAVVVLALVIGGMSLAHPDPDASSPKLLATVLSLFVPMVGGFLLSRMHHNEIARYVWISGLLDFSINLLRIVNGKGLYRLNVLRLGLRESSLNLGLHGGSICQLLGSVGVGIICRKLGK